MGGLTGHNIAITSITATRGRIAVGRACRFSLVAAPRPIHLYRHGDTDVARSNWLSDTGMGLPLNKCFLINH